MNDSPSSSPQMAQSELSRFRQLLVTHFNRAELKELYFELDVNYDALPGEGTRAKALELIYYMGKRGRLNELRSAAAHARQHVEWPDLSTVTFDFSAGRQQLSSAIDPFDVESRIQDLLDRFSKATRQEMRIVGGKYIPSLYFERLRVESNFKRFLASDAACFLVVAKAGRGKTNLMCHIVDELQEQRAVLFLSGRLEPRDNFGIVKHIAGRLGFGEDWSACFEAIKSLASHGPQPLILIDGINESAAEPSEMQAALRELLVQAGEEIKVCVTCRTDFWKFYRAPFWAEYTWQEEGLSYGPRVVRGEDLRPFPEQNFAQIVERYFAFFEVDGELVEEAWERCRNPLLLRFFCEAYRGRAVGIVSQIRLYPLFKLFWNLKVEHVQDMIGLAEQYQVNQFVLTVARLMRQRAQTRVPRDELEAEFGSDLIQPDSMYYRVLDEEIILEEEVDELVGRTNVIFVYDKFSEYAIALSIFADFQLGTSPGDVAVAELQRWMQEETDNQFATLRGALEFLVLCVEDRRPAEWLHFDLIRAMLGFDWKWRRIGGLLAWQLARTNHERYWQFAESLVRHERDFVKRISAEQLGSLSRYHADRALPLLNLCLQDDSASVRQAAEATLLNLSAEATIQEVQLLARQQPLGDGSLPLAGRLLLWPLDSRSPLLQAKVRWLIEVNQDVDIQTAVLGRLEFLESDSRIDLMAFEELQRAFQLGWKRDHRPRNRYLDLVDQQTERLRDALETDLHRLDVLRSVMRQLREFAITQFAMGRTNPGLVMESTLEILAPDISKREDFIGDVVRQFNVPLRQILSEMTNYWSEYYGWSGDRITIGDITLGQIAIEVARREPAFQESDQASLLTELPLAYYPYDATELVQLCLLADRTCLRLAQLSQNPFVTITLATEFGENGVNLGPDQRIAFRTEVAAEIGAELTGIDHRYLSTVGRLTIWLWQTEQQLREQELSLESRVEAFGRMNLDQLRQRFSIFETLSLTDQAQEDLAADLQALCRVPPAARLTAVLTPLIIWHYENDSSAVGQAFQTLYWRNRDGFWDLVNLLLEHEDQRVIDFASQVLEQAEYVEEQGGGSEIFDRVRGIVADLLGVYENEILPETRFREDLEADSLDLVELIMAFEEEFGGEISDEDAVRIVTVGDAVDLMARTELAS